MQNTEALKVLYQKAREYDAIPDTAQPVDALRGMSPDNPFRDYVLAGADLLGLPLRSLVEREVLS